MPAEVTAEDIINIKGQQALLASKDYVAPVNSAENLAQELKDHKAKQLEQKELTFLGTWQVSEAQKDHKVQRILHVIGTLSES